MFLIFLIFFPSFFIFSFSCDPSSGTTWQWFPLVFLFFFFFNFLSSSSCHPSDNRFSSLPLGWVGFPFLFFSLYSLLTRDETTAFLMGGKAINSPTPFTQISWQERPCPAWRVPLSRGSFLDLCLLKAIRTCQKMQNVLQAGVQKTLEHFGQSVGGPPVNRDGNRQGKGRICCSFGSDSQGADRTGGLLFSKCLGGY